jgi:hypothetical protein
MPSRRCTACGELVRLGPDWTAHEREHKAQRDKAYRAKRPGYDHRRWRKVSREFLARHPTCERCGCQPSAHAHHLDGQSPAMPNGMNPARLEAVCTSCHGKIHAGSLPRCPSPPPDPPAIV